MPHRRHVKRACPACTKAKCRSVGLFPTAAISPQHYARLSLRSLAASTVHECAQRCE